MRPDIYIGIGSNLGDREQNLRRAISAIKATGFQLRDTSSIYETEPVDYLEQPWFLNQVARLGLRQSPSIGAGGAMKVLQCLLAIEEWMGRERLQRAGPRTIDLDLLFYGSAIIDQQESSGLAQGPSEPRATKCGAGPSLVVPHPRLHLRRFVLVPLSELTPDLVHPVLGKTVAELLAVVTDKSIVKLYRG